MISKLKELVEYYGKGLTCDNIGIGERQLDNYLKGRTLGSKTVLLIVEAKHSEMVKEKRRKKTG
jgi:hypothetical protein